MNALRVSLFARRYNPKVHWPLFLVASGLETSALVVPFVLAPWWLGVVALIASFAMVPICWNRNEDFLKPILALVLQEPAIFSLAMILTMVPAALLVVIVLLGAIFDVLWIVVIMALLVCYITYELIGPSAVIVIPVLAALAVARTRPKG